MPGGTDLPHPFALLVFKASDLGRLFGRNGSLLLFHRLQLRLLCCSSDLAFSSKPIQFSLPLRCNLILSALFLCCRVLLFPSLIAGTHGSDPDVQARTS